MPEIVDHENGIYVDQLKIIYQSIAQPGADPVATVVLIVDAGTALNRDELRSQLERLHWTRGADGQPEHQPFVSSDRYDHVSWGASGGQLEIVIQAAQLAVGGIVGGMAWDALKKIGQRILSASDPAGPSSVHVDEARAIERGNNSATVVLRGEDGSIFTVQPEMFDGGAIGPITRAYPQREEPQQ